MPKLNKKLLGIYVNDKPSKEINTIVDNLGLRNLSEKSIQMLRTFPEDEREFYINHSNEILPFTDESVKEWFDEMNSIHDYTREDISDLKKTRNGKSKATGLDNVIMSFACNGALKNNFVKDAGSFILFFKQGDDVRDTLLDKIDNITYDANSIFGLDPDHNDEEKIFVSKQIDDDYGRSALVVSYTGFPNEYGAANDIKKLVSDAVPEARIDKNTYAVLESQMKNIKERYSINNGKWTDGKNISLHGSLSSYYNPKPIDVKNEIQKTNKAEMLKKGIDYIDMFASKELEKKMMDAGIDSIHDEAFIPALKSSIKSAIIKAVPLTHVGLNEINKLHDFKYNGADHRIYFNIDTDDMTTAENMRCTFDSFTPAASLSIEDEQKIDTKTLEKEKTKNDYVLDMSLLPTKNEEDEKTDYPGMQI